MPATVNLAPLAKQRFVDNNGAPLYNGKIFTYAAGTTTKQATYTDSTGVTPAPNPILLDGRGEAQIWTDATLTYKFVVAPASDTDPPTNPIWTVDNVAGGDGLIAFVASLLSSIGASLVGFIQSATGAVAQTIQDALRGAAGITLKGFGAKGDGTTNDTAALALAIINGTPFTLTAGTYLIQTSQTIPAQVRFMPGAMLKVRGTGISVTFAGGIEAPNMVIFDTTDDFVTDITAVPSVIVLGVNVKADWFSLKVALPANILTISDQTNNLLKAYRAAVGLWMAVPATANFICQYPQGVVELGEGYYRVDGTLTIGKQVSASFYRTTGFRMFGQGAGSSFLMRTSMASTAQVFSSFYTGEMTHFEKFKVTTYNPSLVGSAQFQSAASALMFLQGDSLQINNIWAAGAQTSSGQDPNGVWRNGVGFQFSSCVDTFFHDLFVEYCVTGLAVYSSIVTGSNLELYHTLNYAIGVGEFESSYPATQATSSAVHITGIQSRANYNNAIFVMEQGATGELQLSDFLFNGFDAETPAQGGVTFCAMVPGASLCGGVTSGSIRNFTQSTWQLQTGCFLGRTDQAFSVTDLVVQGITASINGGVFFNAGTGAFMNLMSSELSVTDCSGLLLQSAQSGWAVLENTTLSRYVGKVDAGASRSLFVGLGADVQLRNVRRNSSDPIALTQFAFMSGGSAYLDVQASINATRTVTGTPVAVRMPTTTAFV